MYSFYAGSSEIMLWYMNWYNIFKLFQHTEAKHGCHFADNIFKFTSMYPCVLTQISLKYVPKSPIDNNSPLVHVMASPLYRQQAIIWTKDGLIHWYRYASLSLD